MTRISPYGRAPIVAVLFLSLASCSSSVPLQEGANDGLTGVDVSNASDAQAAEIGDRVVSVDEYKAAFHRYRDCLSLAGFELANVEYVDFVFEFGVPNAAVEDGADDACYVSEFYYTDLLWQSTDDVQNNSDTAQLLRDCLQQHDVEPEETLKGMDGQMRESGIDIADCLA